MFSSLGVESVVANMTGKMPWSTLMSVPRGLTTLHTPKVAEENVVPLAVPELTLLSADQSCPASNQENIPLQTVSPLPLNVLIPIMEEEERPVQQCCQTTLVVHNQCAVCSKGRIFRPYHCPACMQLASATKVISTLQVSCDQ